MRLSPRFSLLILFVATSGVGCQRLNHERTIDLNEGDVREIVIDGPRGEQLVTVSVNADSPVDVYVVLEGDLEKTRNTLMNQKTPTGELACKRAVRNDSLEATIPARSNFAVLLSGARKRTDVKLKIMGR